MKAPSNLVKALSAPDVVEVYHRPTSSSKPLKAPVSLNGRITAAYGLDWPLLWDCEPAARQGEAGSAITISPVPDRLRYSMSRGSATSQLAWDACGYPNFTTQHIKT